MANEIEPNIKNEADQEDQANLSFSVMPHGDVGNYVSGPSTHSNSQAPSEASQPSSHAPDEMPAEHVPGLFHKKSTFIILGILILIILGAGAYFLIGGKDEKNNEPASKLPRVFLMQYFNVETCTNQALCSDTSDPDQDGLQNYDEFIEQTIPTDNDTDKDGLSDGDEVHVYKINPLKKFTDPRPVTELMGYTDGSQIRNNYDPLTPGLRMTQARMDQIKSDTQSYGPHEPTLTTLSTAVPSTPAAKTVTIFISNNKFDAASVSINTGDTVVWLNKDSKPHQIASDPHPTHTGLPELASGSLSTNQTFSYKFTQAGKFGYHDHLNPSIKGTVEVK